MNLAQRIILTVVVYGIVVYAIAWVQVAIDPRWYDNGVMENLPASEWAAFALVMALIYFTYGLPLLGIAIAIVIYQFKR
jgi:hypothetical protein